MGRLLMSAIIAVISPFFRRWTTKRRAVNSGTEQTDSKRFRGNVEEIRGGGEGGDRLILLPGGDTCHPSTASFAPFEGWDDSGGTNRGAEVCVESLLTRAETGESRGRFVAVQSGWLDGGGEDWRREGRVSTQRR